MGHSGWLMWWQLGKQEYWDIVKSAVAVIFCNVCRKAQNFVENGGGNHSCYILAWSWIKKQLTKLFNGEHFKASQQWGMVTFFILFECKEKYENK